VNSEMKFYLVSTELRGPYEPRACRVVRRLRSEVRDDLALVEIEPPLPRHTYATDEPLHRVVLAARHKGSFTLSRNNMAASCIYLPAERWERARNGHDS
jgi:hypothetical protein